MKTQTIINCVFAVAFVGYVVWSRNPSFNKITCKEWNVVDAVGKERITAFTHANGTAAVQWSDANEKVRMYAGTICDDGIAPMQWLGDDGKLRTMVSKLEDNGGVIPTQELTRHFTSLKKP